MSLQAQAVREAFSALRGDARVHHREIAERLGISEGELIAAHAGSADEPWAILRVTRLRPLWAELVGALAVLGDVTARTANAGCVHETMGVYQPASHLDCARWGDSGTGWAHGFAITELGAQGERHNLQFFDRTGAAVHQILLAPGCDLSAWEALVGRFAEADQQPDMAVQAGVATGTMAPDERIDVRGLREAWRSLRDTHEFPALLRRFGVTRLQALRLAERKFALPVEMTSAHHVLASAAVNRVPVRVLAGNAGLVQVHAGEIDKVTVQGGWVRVQDAGFRLQLREDHRASAWVVRRPTSRGLETSLELFDPAGAAIAMIFGEHAPGRPEPCEWRMLIDGVLKESAAHAA